MVIVHRGQCLCNLSRSLSYTSSRGRQKGGFSRGELSDFMENRSFWGSGPAGAARKPYKKVGGKAPYLFNGFLGRSGPPRTPKRIDFLSNH